MNELDILVENQLSLLSPEYKNLVTGGFTSELAIQFGRRAGIDASLLDEFETDLFFFLIFLQTEDELLQELQITYSIDTAYAALLISAITSQLPIEFNVIQRELKQSKPSIDSAQENAPNGIHTMANDIAAIKDSKTTSVESSYTSTQEALLKEGQKRISNADEVTATNTLKNNSSKTASNTKWESAS